MKTFKINLKKFFTTLGLIAIISGTVYSCKCDKKVNAADGAAAATTAGAGAASADSLNAAEGELDASGNFVRNQGEEQEITLADGTKLMVGSKSTEAKLYNNITGDYIVPGEGGVGPKDWIVMDRVFFASGGDALDANSEAQVDNVSKILKSYPDASVKLGGYTDNTGSEQTNLSVSQKRAEKIKSTLVSKGIEEGRITVEGFGPKYPVCRANDTDACKAQNRRVDIRLTAK